MFFLITSLISIFLIPISWLSSSKIGLADIFAVVYETAGTNLVDQGLSIFAFAFFLYSILKSKSFQSLFFSKIKWLEERKYFTISLITITVALLSSNLSWFDEFVHFYPLIIPLFSAIGFDSFSSVLCLYGGSIAGLLGITSAQRMGRWFEKSFGETGKSFDYNGLVGIELRIFSLAFFISLFIIFNTWYCSRNKNKSSKINNKDFKSENIPKFGWRQKIILIVASFFLFVSTIAQIPQVENKFLNRLSAKIPNQISSSYEEIKYESVGEIGIGRMKIAKIKKESYNYWEKFGNWKKRTLNCWLTIGAVIICLIDRQNIIETLTSATQNAMPLVITYIFSDVPATIMEKSGFSEKIAEIILPSTIDYFFKYKIIFSVFISSLLINFFVSSTSLSASLVKILSLSLLSVSESALIYASIFTWSGAILGMAFSPFNGILQASLEKSKTTYKEFIKKTWILALITNLAMLIFIFLWIFYSING